MNIQVKNLGSSKITIHPNNVQTFTLLPGKTVRTYTDRKQLEGLRALQMHKIEVKLVTGEVIWKAARNAPLTRRKLLLRRIRALKAGIRNINSKLRAQIGALENQMVHATVDDMDVSRFMNVLNKQADSDAKLSIFKQILEENLEIRAQEG